MTSAESLPAMRGVWVVGLLALAMLSGCTDTEGPATVAAAAAPETWELRMPCMGDGGVPELESSFLGSCWGHIGHHTFFVDPPVALESLRGDIFAVEVTGTDVAGEPELPVDVSLDGLAWSRVGTIPYPLGQETEDRYAINVSLDGSGAPFRFLRLSMPPSQYEGLAGYLDGSNLTATVSAWAGPAPPLAERRESTCSDGILESFFVEHPCWFGGYDPLDRLQGGEPTGIHVSWEVVDPSWYDSPSFLHTYFLGNGTGGVVEATARIQMWRLTHYGTCSGRDPLAAPIQPDAVLQASPDGAAWTEVARAAGTYDDPIALSGTVPDGSRFLRFGAETSASFDSGGCHHPVAFVVESGYRIA